MLQDQHPNILCLPSRRIVLIYQILWWVKLSPTTELLRAVRKVRVSQFQPEVTRIVLEFTSSSAIGQMQPNEHHRERAIAGYYVRELPLKILQTYLAQQHSS